MFRAPRPAGRRPERSSGLEDAVQTGSDLTAGKVKLKTIFTSVAGAGNNCIHVGDAAASEMVGGEIGEPHGGQRLKNLQCLGALQGQERHFVADIFDVASRRLWELNPFQILRDIGGVHDQHEVLGGMPIDEQIVHDGPVRIRHCGVLCLPVDEFRRVVGW